MPESQQENVANNSQEVVQPSEGAVVENAQTNVQSSTNEQRSSSEDRNWREVREIMQQQKQKITELEEKLVNKSAPKESIDDPMANLSDDDILTVGDTKKVVANLARKYAKEIVEEKQKKQAIEQVPNQFSDYNDVIKLVDEYVKENPAAEAAIRSSANPRLTAYHMVKSSAMYHRREVSNKEAQSNVQKVIENSQKPGSSQAVGTTSPLNNIGKYEKMTGDRAAKIRKLAEEYAQRR